MLTVSRQLLKCPLRHFVLLSLVATVMGMCVLPRLAWGQASAQAETAPAIALETGIASAPTVPKLIKFTGTLLDRRGYPITVPVDATFALYPQQGSEETSAVWQEKQRVSPNEKGVYTVYLGAVQSLPAQVFTSAAAQYLGIKVESQPEQARVPLTSVPYAMKAADAASLAGIPASNFVTRSELDRKLQARAVAAVAESLTSQLTPMSTPTGLSGSGATGYIAQWQNATNLANSSIYQTGTGTATKIGINTLTPVTVLDLNGSLTIRNTTYMTSGVATAAAGSHSGLFEFSASAFNSSTSAAVPQNFGFEALPVGNNTSTPSGSVAFFYGSGTPGTPAQTGLSFSSKGVITFAPGQTFPVAGTSGGTVKSVALTAPMNDFTVTGSPITGTGAFNLTWNTPPTSADVGSAIIKRNSNGGFAAGIINADSIAIGTSKAPIATLQLNSGDAHNADVLLLGDGTKSLKLSDSGAYVDIQAFNTPLCLNCSTSFPVIFGGSGGIAMGTATPQAALNINYGNHSNADTLLLGDANSKGLLLSDVNSGVDVQAIGVPLYINSLPQVTTINPNGGEVLIDVNDQERANGTNEFTALHVGGFVINDVAQESAIFDGRVDVLGDFYVDGSKHFQIDHPFDPKNKYLTHASIESSEVLNQYSGNVTTDELGLATVHLPDWFGAINVDFRYQLTVIGGRFAQAIVSKEIEKNQFTISTNATHVKVSWQVTARRNDLWMQKHPMIVEELKPVHRRGRYTHPELYGESEQKTQHPAPIK